MCPGRRDGGGTVVLVSHALDEVAAALARVFVLDEGRGAAAGRPAEVFYAEPSRAPATVRVASLLADDHPEVGRPVSFDETLAAIRGVLGGA